MPYDDLGNYIPGDEAELDKMRYELSLIDTIKQMARSPANDLSMLTKPQTYKDIATGLGSAAESMVRGAGAAPFGVAGDIIKHFQDTPLIPGVTDKLSINDIFPGYGTVQEAVAPTPFALPQRRAPNASYAPEVPKQELFGLPYVTTGDILNTAEKRYTPQFGDKEANDFMESLGMFMSPQMAAGARTGIINMVETTGKMPSLGRESVQAFARDYTNAMNGVYPETPTAGSMAADFARTGKAAGRKAGEVVGETIEDLAQRRAAGEGAYANPFSPQSVMADVMAGPRSYAVRPVNAGQMIKETDLPNIKYVESNPKIHTMGYKFEEDVLPYTGEEFPNTIRQEYYQKIFEKDSDISRIYQDWANNKFMQMYPDAPTLDAARSRYSNQGNLKDRSKDQLRMMSEFAESPEVNEHLNQVSSARDSAIEEYNEVKNKPKDELKTDEEKELHKAKIDELELELLKNDFAPELTSEQYRKRIEIPTAEEYLRRANAARKYIMGEFRNDIAKYTGTSQGPQMELAKKGITFVPKEDLLRKSREITQGGQDFRDLQKKREEAGFKALGEMQPLIDQKEAELAKLQEDLNAMNAKRNDLRDQHRLMMPDEPDPARNPTEIGAQYRALKNPMSSLIDKMEKTKKQVQNFQLANAYETISDLAYTPYPASHWRKVIPYEQKDFFPDLFAKRENGEYKIPDDAPMFNVDTRRVKQIGTDTLAEQYTDAILDGRVPIDDKGKPAVSIDKFIEQITRPRVKEEELKNIEGARAKIRLNDYAQNTLASIPADMRFQNASALELTSDNPMPVIRRQVSFDGMVLDNCVAGCSAPHPGINPFTNQSYNNSYPVDVATGANRGDRQFNSSYMEAIRDGDQRYASLRDNDTGIPVVNINMLKTSGSGSANPKYNVQYVSGYQNNQIDKKYTNDVRDYLNARADIIQGSGDGLNKWGIFDLTSPAGQRAAGRALGVPETALSSFDLPRFVTEKDIRDLASKQPVGESHADLVAARDRLSEELRPLIRDYGFGAPETHDIQDQLTDIEARLAAISNQVRNAPSTQGFTSNLFRRMSTEPLRNGLELEGGLDRVSTIIDNLIDQDSFGLRELWSDDYEFYPVALRNFINGIRNGENLPVILTNRTDASAFATQMRDRLARFQIGIEDLTPMQRELLVRELDNYAETNINQMADTLDDDTVDGLRLIEDNHPGTIQYLQDIETRRRGQDFQPETQARPALGAPTNVPRDIAEQLVPTNQAFRDQTVQEVTEALNNSVRNLPTDRETIIEAIDQYNRDPLDIPGSIAMILPIASDRTVVSNYLVQHLQSRLGERNAELRAPATPVGENVSRAIDSNRQALTQTYPHQTNNFELIHNDAQNNAVMAARQGRDANNAYLDTIQTHIDRLRRGRQTTERVELMPLVQEFYDDVARATARDGIAPAQLPVPQGAPQRSTAQMNAVTDLVMQLFRSFEAQQFDRGDLTSTLHALDARNFDHPRLRTMSAEVGAPASDQVQEDVASALRVLLQGRNIDVPPDIFANGVEVQAAPPRPAVLNDETIASYRDHYTNPETNSNRAFDNVMLAERMTPGAINEAILRTDGQARYDVDIQRFYNVDSPAGISQLNNALRRYMEDNGFDVPPRPLENAIDELEARFPAREEAVVEPEAALQGSLEAAREFYNDAVVQEMTDLVDNIQNDDIRFDREPDEFLARLRDEANEYADHNQAYSNAVDEMANFLENYMRERAANRPEGRKRGGYIKKKMMNGGGKVEPVSPSSTVNDQSKPVTPPKKIINPDAPEFKDIYNRERAIRGGGGGSGSPADLKQMMNPRNITYNAGGNVSVDQMRYELLRK
jgi:hypothetical protein